MDTRTLDKKYFAREKLAIDIEPVKSEDSFLIDSEGKRYIDFVMGWCVGNTGWDNQDIEKVMHQPLDTTYIYPGMLYRPWAELAEMLAEITPGKLKKSFRTTGGTEAVETAMQIAMCYTGRHKFMSIEGSYHGNSIATLSIGSSENRKTFHNLLPGCYKVNPPLDHKSLAKIETRLKKRDIAAFIMEPVLINLGVLVPETEFMQGLQTICRKYGTLLVMDEVATGFGRTGKLFATEHFGIEPDILCMAKAITGGYAAMGAAITTSEIAKAVEDKINIYSTYGWHPMSVEVAIANIKHITDHQYDLLQNVSEMEELFSSRLGMMRFKMPATIRVKGLAIGIEVGDEEYAKRIQDKCRRHRLLVNRDGTKLSMFPALNIERDIAEKGLDIFESCIS